MDKVFKVFGKKKFKGEGRKLGDNPSSSATSSQKREAGTKSNSERKAFSGKPRILTDGASRPSPSGPLSPQQGQHGPQGGKYQSPEAASPSDRPSHKQSAPMQSSAVLDIQASSQHAAEIADEQVQVAVAQLDAAPDLSKEVLRKVLANILRLPEDPKFRKVRLANPRIKEAIVDVEGALELLQAVGFEMAAAEGSDDVQLILPQGTDLTQLEAAACLIGSTSYPAAQSPSRDALSPAQKPIQPSESHPTSSTAPAEPCNRETQVIMPAATESGGEVPDWVFKRSPVELKAAMQAAQRKRQQDEMLMTRAMREKLNVGKRPHYSTSNVRVKMPEGLLLQGKFRAKESVSAIFDWMTGCLASPGLTYDLILPDRRALTTNMGTLAAAQLVPSVLLLFRATSEIGKEEITLNSEVLSTLSSAST